MDKIKNLEKEIVEEKKKRTKLMWEYATVGWKLIIILGVLAYIAFILFLIGFFSAFLS